MTFQLLSSAFHEGAVIPKVHTCEGEDMSAPLSWNGEPSGTQSFAIICEDPDAPGGTWYHWGVFDIPKECHELKAGIATKRVIDDMRQAVNSFQRVGYGGPCPPKGHGRHHYRFRLFALSAGKLAVPAQVDCATLANLARKAALAETVLTGLYERS